MITLMGTTYTGPEVLGFYLVGAFLGAMFYWSFTSSGKNQLKTDWKLILLASIGSWLSATLLPIGIVVINKVFERDGKLSK